MKKDEEGKRTEGIHPYQKIEWAEHWYYESLVKKKTLKPIHCISTWMDICGFGKKLAEANWDISKAQEDGLLGILSEVYGIAAFPRFSRPPPEPSERILILNDGIARTLDLYPVSSYEAITMALYFRDLMLMHSLLVRRLLEYDLGLRTIITGGERIQYSPSQKTGESLLHHSANGPSPQGKRFLDQIFLYHPVEFQMNTAFSRAYIIDYSGTKHSIKPNAAYIDSSCLEKINIVIPDVINIIEKDNKGVINISKNKNNLISLIYDDVILFNNKSIKTKIYKITKMIVHKYLEGEKTEIPLNVNEIIKVKNTRGILTVE